MLTLRARNVGDYECAFLKAHLLRSISRLWCIRSDVPVRFARTLGFARTGPVIEALVWKLMPPLIKAGTAERHGRGDAAKFRKV